MAIGLGEVWARSSLAERRRNTAEAGGSIPTRAHHLPIEQIWLAYRMSKIERLRAQAERYGQLAESTVDPKVRVIIQEVIEEILTQIEFLETNETRLSSA